MSEKRVALVPTKAMTEGISAIVAFSPEADLAANAEAMEKAGQAVGTLGVTYATRPIQWGDVHAEAGQAIGVRGDDILAAGDDPLAVAESALRLVGLDTAELLTIYSGSDAPLDEAHRLLERLRQQFGISRSSSSKAASPTTATSSHRVAEGRIRSAEATIIRPQEHA
jgi:dihydroxyacetone kinase-like predicted kinase